MDFFSKKARGITPYTAGEQPKDKRYVKLNTNENPYPPSPKAEEALRSFHADELNLYPSPDSDLLRRAVAEAEGTEPENVFCSNGSDEALYLAFAAFFDADGTGACFPDLTYSFYRVFAGIHGISFTQVPLNGDFTMDLSRMRETDCQGYFIANPNAPTGAGIPLSEMEKFISSVPDRIVIADEAYMDFYGQSCATLIRKYRNLLVIKTFSKSYSLAGIRCGYAIGDRA
ncbi:MAG: aminotransferase class I/II-fold pyridoxal phosphate-dependent enzyme, partial [Clostridia bacterium]|nr:aminotransferase class I/II-fold pyridoxal phosphate-dependent enzyme [Clostridia bacterium]